MEQKREMVRVNKWTNLKLLLDLDEKSIFGIFRGQCESCGVVALLDPDLLFYHMNAEKQFCRPYQPVLFGALKSTPIKICLNLALGKEYTGEM